MLETIIIRLLYMLPQLVITIGCVIYLKSGNKLAGVLMLCGTLLGLVFSLLSLIIQCLAISQAIDNQIFGQILTIINPVWIITSLLFAAGFIIMALNAGRPAQEANASTSL